MNCIAVIQANRIDVDTVILWDDGSQLVAFAYLEGRVMRTRPLAAKGTDDAINEVRDTFQLTSGGQVTRIRDWVDTVARTEPIADLPRRWGG